MGSAGWAEAYKGTGLARAHRVACASSADRKPRRACGCPWTFWVPDPTKRSGQRRERLDGALTLTQVKASKQRMVDAARDQMVAAANHAALPAGGRLTVRDWAIRVFRTEWADRKPKTLQTWRGDYEKRIDPHLGHHLLEDVTPLLVQDWIARLITERGHMCRSIEKAVQTLGRMMVIAEDLEVIDRNPVRLRRIPTTPKDAPGTRGQRRLTRTQYEQLLAACETNLHRVIVRLATEACLRQSEIAALCWNDVLFDHARLHAGRGLTYTPETGRVLALRKGEGPARPAMSRGLCDLLHTVHVEHMVEYGSTTTDPVVRFRAAPAKGYEGEVARMCFPDSLGQLVRKLVVRAGLVGEDGKALVSIHDLRRTGASLMEEAGYSETDIQHQLGHAPGSRTTRAHYLRVDETQQAAVAGAFE